jgi:predicted dehydrogenase
MTSDISRRSFLKSSALGASAVALGTQSVARGFPANEKVQLGWIGLGSRWRSGLSGMLYNYDQVSNVAVCDLIPEKIDLGKERFERDNPTGYTDFRKMMEKEKLDGIVVATEPCNHAQVVAPVLDAGFNCFAEKPVDTTVEKVDIIVKAARRAAKNGKFYQVGTQRRFSPVHRKAMEIINGGRIGKVMFMQGHWHWAWRPPARMVARDGGFLVEQASHHTDVFAWAMKDTAPLTCLASARTVVDAPQGPNVVNEQQSAVIWTWPTGEILSYTHLLYLARRFQDEKLWVHCEKAGVEVNQGLLHHVNTKDNPYNPKQKLEDLQERFAEGVGEDWGAGTREELEGFVAGIKAGPGHVPYANIESGRVSTLMTIMGRMAMINAEKNCFEPHLVTWKDIGSETDL